MKKVTVFTILMLAMAVSLLADYSDSEKIEKSLTFPDPKADNTLSVENVNGWIEVTGYAGDEIILEVEKIIEADSKSDMEKGMEEAKLGLEVEGRFIRIFDDGPWQDRHFDWDDLDYTPTYNFTLKVPENINIELGTVNGEYVKCFGVKGSFKLNNVNGKILCSGVEHYGKANTVNGDIDIEFARSPKDDCRFNTVNGDITVAFPKDLNAEFKCKTLNGDVYTDFETSSATSHDISTSHKGGKYVFESDNSLRLTIGEGGPQIKMTTINGDISIPLAK